MGYGVGVERTEAKQGVEPGDRDDPAGEEIGFGARGGPPRAAVLRRDAACRTSLVFRRSLGKRCADCGRRCRQQAGR